MTRFTIEVDHDFFGVPHFSSLRHVILTPKTEMQENKTANA